MSHYTFMLVLSLVCLPCEARLTVNLRFESGKTALAPGPKDEVREALEAAVRALDKPYRFAMSEEEKRQDNAGRLEDDLTREVRDFTGDWETFAERFIQWTAAVPTRRPADQVLSALAGGLYAPLQSLHYTTPLLFDDFPGDGTVVFEIAPPIDPAKIEFALPGVADAGRREKRIRQLRLSLEPLRGQPWFAERLQALLLEFYDRLDLAPTFEFDARDASIRIVESPRIARILFPDDPGSRKALYLVLSGKDYRKHSHDRPPIVFPPGEEPYLGPARLADQQILLAQAGFKLSVQADAARPSAVALVIEALPEEPSKQIGGGFQYRHEQGIRLFGLGSREPVSGQLAMDGNLPSPSLAWLADFILFDKLDRRLSLALNDASQAESNRVLDGRTVNERRSGGTAHAEFELFRNLKFYVESRLECVTLDGESRRFASADLGAIYSFEDPGWRARFDVRAGLAFPRLITAASVHRELPRRFAADIRARYEWAGERAPWFELPSLGGPENLRGFRRDYAVARRLWSVQPEIWAPVPVNETWRKHVKLAGFTDAGGVPGSIRYAPGLGVRVLFHPVIVQLDCARGKFYFNVTTTIGI